MSFSELWVAVERVVVADSPGARRGRDLLGEDRVLDGLGQVGRMMRPASLQQI